MDESTAVRTYPLLEENIEDDISHERNLQQIKKILQSAKPNHEICKDLMARTFVRRRSSIMDNVKPVDEICFEYPLLRKSSYVIYRTCRYM